MVAVRNYDEAVFVTVRQLTKPQQLDLLERLAEALGYRVLASSSPPDPGSIAGDGRRDRIAFPDRRPNSGAPSSPIPPYRKRKA